MLRRFVLLHVTTLAGPERCCLHCWGRAAAGWEIPRTILGLLPSFTTLQLGVMGSARPDTGIWEERPPPQPTGAGSKGHQDMPVRGSWFLQPATVSLLPQT